MMHPAQSRIEAELMAWAARHPDCHTAPPHIEVLVEQQKRYAALEYSTALQSMSPQDRELTRQAIEEDLAAYSVRREAEQELSVYVDQVASSQLRHDLYEKAQALHDCRGTGAAGIKPDGGTVIAWDQKCGITRLCPDESRENTQRLSEWYQPPILKFKDEKPTHRVFYAVFTVPNYAPGQLAKGKRQIIQRFRHWLDQMTESKYCPIITADEATQSGPACAINKPRKGKLKPGQPYRKAGRTLADIKGSLVIQEDPLSAGHDWNVHLNVFLLVNGRFDYDLARAAWDANVEIQDEQKIIQRTREKLGREVDFKTALRHGLIEAIKYSAQIVPDKSASKAQGGSTEAPAMTQWPHTLWLEWWDAGIAFRRVRSYGCLYGLHRKRWDSAEAKTRRDWCELTKEQVLATSRESQRDAIIHNWNRQHWNEWTEIIERDRARLRKVMTHGAPLDMSLIQWVGAVNLNDDLSYRVGSIPGDNFLTGRPRRNNLAFDFYRARGPT